MDKQGDESTDGSSIRPVSSLRSLFENKATSKSTSPTNGPSSNIPRQPSPQSLCIGDGQDGQRVRPDGRFSLDMPRPISRKNSPPREVVRAQRQLGNDRLIPEISSRNSSRPRPISMGPLSPPRSPPKVMVESPGSPPKTSDRRPLTPLSLGGPQGDKGQCRMSRPASPIPRKPPEPPPSRNDSPARPPHSAPLLKPSSAVPVSKDPDKPAPSPNEPPPINRAGKPKIFSKGPAARQVSESLAPAKTTEPDEERISPFSTPPSSGASSPEPGGTTLPPIREDMKPKFRPTGQTRKDYVFPAPGAPTTGPPPSRKKLEILPPPIASNTLKQATERVGTRPADVQGDMPEDRPGLPPRRETIPDDKSRRRDVDEAAPELPVRRSLDHGFRGSPLPNTSTFMPPPKRIPSLPTEQEEPRSRGPAPPPPRASNDWKRGVQEERRGYTSESDVESTNGTRPSSTSLSDYPDSSQANRRPPLFSYPPHELPTKYDTKLFAVCGEFVCTSGYITRAWNVSTGEILMTMSHGETVKMTAVAFKPATEVEDEGKRIWLGSTTGDIIEVDIPSQSIVNTRSNAHSRREIIKIYRHASNMWSLDDDGRLLIWIPDVDGSLSLSITPRPFNVSKGHSFSILTGNKLWIASGKDIRVWQYDAPSDSISQVTVKPLSQPGVGEVTSGSVISGQGDRIYFGHVDGKVTIYSKKDYTCLGVVNVSLYRISSLVGVGDYLWAGYNTGKIYVYDTLSKPWKVKKDWNAHEDRIAGIVVDHSSLWKLDRLQVASLGTDNAVRIWDGMLREDCLEADMYAHDVDFCDFREISATVMTWNAGAAKPTWLRQEDSNFFRELLTTRKDPPDILVFGFQELVDLEKKSITAKSLFKRNKKKDMLMDGSVQEHMSHQYRAWRDHLEREIAVHIKEPYVLLHTANLIGLFTCVFVKASERENIRDVNAAEVKLGMGGHYGNKGALIVRFALDDSSLCFVNCHLAAGQTQTVNRNNDIAAIMESSSLPQKVSSTGSGRSDLFVSGGDGTMILDHEICILNGDLNYRIDTMPRDQVISAVKQGNLVKLLERDQLLLSRKRNPGFRLRAFTESPLTFAPTYKYDVGTDNYDSSEKKRSPAWCDRLLYRGYGSIKQLEYRRHEVRVSDHRPVSGAFKLRIKTINPGRRKVVWNSCEERFEDVKQRIAMNTKLDYLINVLGCSEREAERLLKK